VLVLLAATGLLLAATLLHHLHVSLRLRWQRRRQEALLAPLCRAVNDPDERETLFSQVRASDGAVLLPMLLQLSLDLRGEETRQIGALAEELGVTTRERRRLDALRATERSEAAKNLGLLRSQPALPRLLHIARTDRRREVRLAAATAMGEIGGRRAVLGLLSMLDDPSPGVVRCVQEVLLDAAPDAAREIAAHARRTRHVGARRAAVELLGALRDPQASELLLELADTPEPELRTKVIKAAAAIGDPRFREIFRAGLEDPAWPVRCQAATGLGAIGASDAIPELCQALSDEAWWVRFNAASALAELGAGGRAALAEQTTSSEASRRDVARYVLERRGLEELAA
jgi:HEAT repeat protein